MYSNLIPFVHLSPQLLFQIQAIDLDPQDPVSMLMYAVFLDKTRKLKDAEHYYLRSLECDPNYVQVRSGGFE